ncbi:hypothetical protein FACS189461_0590 [Spirochaetia bacterium]|nr:hypothetical protein FACS189461_0590 [Spirochaetia bacterium]
MSTSYHIASHKSNHGNLQFHGIRTLNGIDPVQYAEEIIEALDDSNGENIEYYSEDENKGQFNG